MPGGATFEPDQACWPQFASFQTPNTTPSLILVDDGASNTRGARHRPFLQMRLLEAPSLWYLSAPFFRSLRHARHLSDVLGWGIRSKLIYICSSDDPNQVAILYGSVNRLFTSKTTPLTLHRHSENGPVLPNAAKRCQTRSTALRSLAYCPWLEASDWHPRARYCRTRPLRSQRHETMHRRGWVQDNSPAFWTMKLPC